MEGGNYIVEAQDALHSTFFIFSMKEQVGALAQALKIFEVGAIFVMVICELVYGAAYTHS